MQRNSFTSFNVSVFSLRGLLWGRLLPECWRWSRPSIQLHLPLPPNQQGVTLTCSTYLSNQSQVTFQFKPPSVEPEALSPPYLVRNTASFRPLACRGSKPVQPEKEDIKWVEKKEEEEKEGNLMMIPGGSIFGMSWNRGEDTEERGGEDDLLHMSGGLFLLKQDRASWTLFLLMIYWFSLSLCLYYCFVYFCVVL